MATESTVTRLCDVCGRPVSTTGTGNFLIAMRHTGCAVKFWAEQGGRERQEPSIALDDLRRLAGFGKPQ